MRKFELSLSSDYVPNWDTADAIRELFQNALDQEVQNPDNKMSWLYDDETLVISNKRSSLNTQSLLLGHTSKRDDAATIGQFGEGYKIAALVLLRTGHPLTIYNYAEREIWHPKLVDSRRYGARVLTFFIEKVHVWDKVPDNDLTIAVSNITLPEFISNIVPTNLHMQEEDVHVKATTEFGDILDSEKHAGQVFVNGLYVCKYEPYSYGYNFKPGSLKLDRDRKLVSDFDLRWLASRMWVTQPDVAEHIADDIADVSYVANMSHLATGLSDDCYDRFCLVYGPNAVPVVSQSEADKIPHGYKSVFVSDNYRSLIVRSAKYTSPAEDYLDPYKQLRAWLETVRDKLTQEECDQFNAIMEEID